VAGALALLLQCAVARLALASEVNLAVAIADRWKLAAPVLGVVFAAAIIATDLAEFAGIAVGLQLFFGFTRHCSANWTARRDARVCIERREFAETRAYVNRLVMAGCGRYGFSGSVFASFG
jgi:hypothetical protein